MFAPARRGERIDHRAAAERLYTAETKEAETPAPAAAPGKAFSLLSAEVVDRAAKRRWIQLPEGATIDTSDMDYWQFPVGTKLWKEFVRDGVRVFNPRDEGSWYDAAGVLEKFGVRPDQVVDALVEGHETFDVELSSQKGAGAVIGTGSYTLTRTRSPTARICAACASRLPSHWPSVRT